MFRNRQTGGKGNPWATVMTALRKPLGRLPKRKTVWQLWWKQEPALVEARCAQHLAETGEPPSISTRCAYARELFETLPQDTQDSYARQADAVKAQEREKHLDDKFGKPSDKPEDQEE